MKKSCKKVFFIGLIVRFLTFKNAFFNIFSPIWCCKWCFDY